MNTLLSKLTYIKAPAPTQNKELGEVESVVRNVIRDVREHGDSAVCEYSKKFDRYEGKVLEVSMSERLAAVAALDPQTRKDTEFAIARVREFAEAQLATMLPLEVEQVEGVHLGHRIIPIERIGAYVPGGRYPILSAPVMTIVPAKVAGCDEVVACLPPNAHQAMIAGCHLSGADRIFRVGGAQAIAAMAYGTESIPPVDKIVGPGNAYVNEAKRQVFGQVGIDQLAGPSEIFILADESADPHLLAIDMLAQAEHDIHTRVGLITTSQRVASQTLDEVIFQLKGLSTANVAEPAWREFGEIVLCPDEATMLAYSDYVAAEHLQVHTKDAHATAKKLRNYGSLFIDRRASVVYSDKCCGTNHTLPTMRAGRYTGGLWVGSFVKVCTHQWMDQAGVELVAPPAMRQSATEGMEGHRRAAAARLEAPIPA
jgi:histidinol dehydrogenase/sulfopropanediol 3-dehydrogenase